MCFLCDLLGTCVAHARNPELKPPEPSLWNNNIITWNGTNWVPPPEYVYA